MRKIIKTMSISLIALLFASFFSINFRYTNAAATNDWIYCNLEDKSVIDDSNKEIHFGLISNLKKEWTFYVKAGTKEIKLYRHANEEQLAHAKFLLVAGKQNATSNEYELKEDLPITNDIANCGYNVKEEPITVSISENARDGHNIMIYSQEIKSGNFNTTNAFINLVIIGDKSPKSLRIINKTNSTELEEFVYHIWGTDETTRDIDIVIICQSNSDMMITDLPMGSYKVEQDGNWSFSYKTDQSVQDVTIDEDKEVIFNNEKSFINWLVSITKKGR